MMGIALGAVAACLGIAVALGDVVPMPALFGLCALGAALALGRGGRGPMPLRSHSGPKRPKARAGSEPEAREADLLGHEMKNYLCTLKGNARLLRQRVQRDDQAILDRIDHVVEKLEAFTCSLAGAGADGATAPGVLRPMRPSQAAQACAQTHFHKRMGVFRYFEDPESPSLLCDPGRFDQVFLNLYANALEAGARRIDTAVRREGGRLIVRIEDDGHGCAPEDLMRIFEPFFTTKPGPARRGLGMFIVRSIVENHGGRIGVATKNGGPDGRTGLVFTLEFPPPLQGRPSAQRSPSQGGEASRGASAARPAPEAVPVLESWTFAPDPLPYQRV